MGDCFSGKEFNVLVIGLNSAGKSTIINNLKPSFCQTENIKPTNGFETPWIPFRDFTLKFKDMGGAANFRPLWQNHADNVDGIIFVVDSSDSTRFPMAKEELHAVLALPSIQARPIPILVLANKNDLEESAPLDMIQKELDIASITNHVTSVLSVCAFYPREIFKGLEWLVMRRA